MVGNSIRLGFFALVVACNGGSDVPAGAWIGGSSSGTGTRVPDDDQVTPSPAPSVSDSVSESSGSGPTASSDPSGGTTSGGTADESSTGELPPQTTGSGVLCEQLTFDNEPGAPWVELPGPVTIHVAGGELNYSIPAGTGLGILQYGAPVDFSDTVARIQVTRFTATAGGTLLGISLDTGPVSERLALQLQAGNLESHHTVPGEPIEPLLSAAPPLPFYLQLRAEDDVVYFEVSSDAADWTILRTVPRPDFLDAVNVGIVAGNHIDIETPHSASIGELELCAIE